MKKIAPFDNCPALDGYHCVTNSLAKIYHFHKCPLSEEMILGLGSGMGFIYWKMKELTFVGGRGNVKNFFADLGRGTSVKIEERKTASSAKAEKALLDKLREKQPVMLFGDMGFLPWFDLPEDYHFGGHSFVVCGYDGKSTVLASDMDQKSGGLKKGFYHAASLEQLRKARCSKFKPFPPKNTWLEFDFSKCRMPGAEDIFSSIRQTAEAMLDPPIKNMGVKGIRHSAGEILKWPEIFKDKELRMTLFSLYIFIEIGGSGGGCFRYMYSRFLKEAARIAKCKALDKAAALFHESGELFTKLANLFTDALTAKKIDDNLAEAGGLFRAIADLEEKIFDEVLIPALPG